MNSEHFGAQDSGKFVQMDVAKRKRTAARGRATRATEALKLTMATPSVSGETPGASSQSSSPEREQEIVVKEAIAELEKALQHLANVQEDYEAFLETDTVILEEVNAAEDFKEKCQQVRVNALCWLKTKSIQLSTSNPREQDCESVSRDSRDTCEPRHLPKLELPRFSGHYMEWQSFYDQFKAIVHSSDLPAVSKFSYLRSLLDGEARAAIAGLSLTDTHYTNALELLERRYGRKEKLIFTHIQELLSMKTTESASSDTTASLWALQDALMSHMRSLEGLGVSGDKYGVILTPLILSRLPTDIRLEWARSGEGKEDNLDFLLKFLSEEIRRRERSQTFLQRTTNAPPTAAALATTSKSKASNRVCNVCNKQGHSTASCFKLTRASMAARRDKLKTHNLCYRCLSADHFASDCRATCRKCSGSHHFLLCEGKFDGPKKRDGEGQAKVSGGVSGGVSEGVACMSFQHLSVMLQTADVPVIGRSGKTVMARVLLDTGSDRTYVSTHLADAVRPEWVRADEVSVSAFGSNSSSSMGSRNVYHMKLQGINSISSIEAVSIPSICSLLQRRRVAQSVLSGLEPLAADYSTDRSVRVDILLGLDNYWRFVQPGIKLLQNGLVAQKTLFGWILSGCAPSPVDTHSSSSMQLLTLTDLSQDHLRRFWELDEIGVRERDETIHPCVSRFQDTVDFRNGRYVVALPWKKNRPDLLDNKTIAEGRLKSLQKKLERDVPLKESYHQAIKQMKDLDIIEEVPHDEVINPPENKTYYLPHRPVIKPSSTTTKVRPVFDASCPGYNGVSLNDCLEIGPSLIPNLVDVLLRFRRWPVAISADITKAFLQVAVQQEDCDVHRFLWDDAGTIRVMRFLRVPFGNCSSPFLLNATIAFHLTQQDDSEAVRELGENLYVDDWLSGANSVSEACALFDAAEKVLRGASMPLAKCSTNSAGVASRFNLLDSVSLGGDSVKVLGLRWDTTHDTFTFSVYPVPDDLIVTKRVILSFIARIFDPVGFSAPFVMTAKIMLQDVWSLGLDWDAPVPDELGSRFLRWLSGLVEMGGWSIPRAFFPSKWNDAGCMMELHAFGDASKRAYGAVIFLRVRLPNGESRVSFVASKGRVAPVKAVTLPRLELLAALCAARLLSHVIQALHLENCSYFCYSDSMLVLHWIKSEPSRWKPFVANRVAEIQDLTAPSCWKHCPGSDNPADLISRGTNGELAHSDLWLKGPVWLQEGCYGKFEGEDENIPSGCVEERKAASQCLLQTSVPCLFEFDRFSSWTRLLRVVGWVKRFVARLRGSPSTGELTLEELSDAKTCILQVLQRQHYDAEVTALTQGSSVPRNSSILKLCPFLDDSGLLRVKGRLQFSDLSYGEKHPIVLPKCHVTLLLVQYQHSAMHHAGVASLVTRIRSEYWVIGLRQIAKRVKRFCVSCQRHDGKACSQPMAPLPALRVRRAPPFSVVGIDHAGPLFCADFPGTKFYILLSTCGVVRALHLELVPSMSAEDTLLALRRLFARRGLPSVIFSDNARGFQACERALAEQFGASSPSWKFIAPQSPWWGGWWERLVRSVKSSLRKTLGQRSLIKNELETLLVEIEAQINARPLTFVGDSIDDQQPLTPSHFLIQRSSAFCPPENSNIPRGTTDILLLKGSMAELSEIFWSLWSSEYIRNLPVALNKASHHPLSEGSVVLLEETGVPRLRWPLGRVVSVHQGRDSLIRAVDVKTASGTYTRSVQRLHCLEFDHQEDSAVEDVVNQGEQSGESERVSEDESVGLGERVSSRTSRFGRAIKSPSRLDL